MQVIEPIDIADCLRVDLAEIYGGLRFFCIPIPLDLGARDVVIEQLGGSRVSGVSNIYDVTIGVYASDDEEALNLANKLYAVVSSLPLRDTSTQYSDVSVNLPYSDPDERAPNLSRQSFRASIICPGNRIEI